MSLQAKTYLNLLAGGLAGVLAWVLTDLTGWFADIFQPHKTVHLGLFAEPKFLLYGALFGLLLGVLFGVVDSLSLVSASRMRQLLVMSAVIGFAGGWLGLALGEIAYGEICGAFNVDPDTLTSSTGSFLVVLIGRALGYAFIGGFIGAAQGVSRHSKIIAKQGAFGGVLGGLLGGMSFELTSRLVNSPIFGRLVALVITGALIGFFVGLVQNLFKQAWVRLVLGRNEGKEFLIAKPVTTVGRSELADIALFGDPAIAPTHLAIEALPQQNRHRLRFVGEGAKRGETFAPPLVNGQPVAGEQWLADGDTIQLGKQTTLLFHEKATRREGAVSTPGAVVAEGAGTAGPGRYVGQELSEAGRTPRPALTPSPEVVAQMGAWPSGDETVMSVGPGTAASGGAGTIGELGTRLVCTQGPYAGQSFALSHAPATIGRAPEREIALPADTSVSRSHARIAYQSGRHVISDDGSSNGTLVNGRRLAEPRPLSPGDLVQIGETVLRYE